MRVSVHAIVVRKWEWILKSNLFCDRISLLRSVQMHENRVCSDGNEVKPFPTKVKYTPKRK